jgi:NAD+ synthase
MDLALWSLNNGVSAAELAKHLAITEEQVGHIYDDIRNKRNTTKYLHSKAFLIEEVEGLPT